MAHITTDTYYDQITLSAQGERITIANGATLTVRASNSAAGFFPVAFDVSDGVLLFSTTGVGASAPIIFFLSNTGTGAAAQISCSADGIFRTRGQWYDITTSAAGTANETYILGNYPSNKRAVTTVGTSWTFPFVRVETGPSTNQWRYYLNYGLSGIIAPATVNIVRNLTTQGGATAGVLSGHVGSGTGLGEFFKWTPSTSAIEFGSGTTGALLYGGGRVQIPDIFISTTGDFVSATASRVHVNTANTGILDLDTVMFSDRVDISALQPKSVYMKDVGCSHFAISECYDVSLSTVMVPPCRTAETLNCTLANVAGEMVDCKIANTFNSQISFAVAFADPFVFRRNHIINQSRLVNTTIAWNNSFSNNVEYYDNVVVGGSTNFATCNTVTITGHKVCSMNTGSTANASNNTRHDAIVLNPCVNSTVRDIDFFGAASGTWAGTVSAPRLAAVNVAANSKNTVWTNDRYELNGADVLNNVLTLGLFAVDTTVARIKAKRVLTTYLTDSNAVLNVNLSDWVVTGWPTLLYGHDARAFVTQAINMRPYGVQAVWLGGVMLSPAVYDSSWMLFKGGSGAAVGTTGMLWKFMSPPINRSYYSVISGSPVGYNSNGLYRFSASGDIVDFVTDFKVLGATSIYTSGITPTSPLSSYGVALSASSGFRNNVNIQYAIRPATADDFFAFKDASSANFFAENLVASADPSVGFYWKWRMTCTATPSVYGSNSLCGIGVAFNFLTPNTVRFPVGYVTLELQNIVANSQVWVKLNATSEVLTNTTSTGGSMYLSVPYDYDGTTPTVTVRVRKSTAAPKYVPFETTGSYNQNGGTVFVSQVEDTIA